MAFVGIDGAIAKGIDEVSGEGMGCVVYLQSFEKVYESNNNQTSLILSVPVSIVLFVCVIKD